jgi:membrane-associated protease RseP (regulator of RpoE activity)
LSPVDHAQGEPERAEGPVPSRDSEFSGSPFLPEAFEPDYLPPQPPRPRKFQSRFWLHVLLFLLTLAITTLVGADHYVAFLEEFQRREVAPAWGLLVNGFWYSGTILAILGAHEMGHYLLCRRYDVDATLPYFIPAPLPLTGTLGAVIKIREPFPTRSALFDIGIAGPIAGFVVLVPALLVGLTLSTIVPEPKGMELVYLGEPLLFKAAVKLMVGDLPAGYTLNMHPMVFAAWFGMLATALNLLPFGQLDGGHVTYATLGRYSTPISLATVGGAVAMTFVSNSWIFMTVMMLVMLLMLGPRHPRVIYEHEPIGAGRAWLAVFALVMLVICFTPVPIEFEDLIRNP